MTEKQYELGTICLNEMGDVIIVWDDEGSGKMKEWVQRMMNEGATFFVLKQRAFGFLPPSKVELKKLSQLSNGTALAVSEDIFSKLTEKDTSVALAKRPAGVDIDTVKQAETVDEVVTSQTIMVQPRRGG